MSRVLEFASSVVKNLPEVDDDLMLYWIGAPLELQKALAGLGRMSRPEPKIWKTIKLGTGIKDAEGFRKSIKDKQMRIGEYADDILGKPQFTVAVEETDVDLVVISVAELGFKDGAKREDIYARAKELGLQLCPPEIGPQLRLQYADQPKDEWLIIGMDPITVSDGLLRLFVVGHDDGGLWLDSYFDCPDSFWVGRHRFVFVLPRK